MRKGKLASDEIYKAEKAKDDRQRSRAKGFGKMRERDAGYAQLSNGVIMEWPIPGDWSEPSAEGIQTWTGNQIPEGMFVLKVGDRAVMFDTEEFRGSLRWA